MDSDLYFASCSRTRHCKRPNGLIIYRAVNNRSKQSEFRIKTLDKCYDNMIISTIEGRRFLFDKICLETMDILWVLEIKGIILMLVLMGASFNNIIILKDLIDHGTTTEGSCSFLITLVAFLHTNNFDIIEYQK